MTEIESSFMGVMLWEAARADAERVEAMVRDTARAGLPRGLRWLADRPRLLAVAYRVRPSWRPTVVCGFDPGVSDDSSAIVFAMQHPSGATLLL